ncbi:PD-(D/E)XK motif protein [Kribbella sp. NPDC051936]|uniref:PD-(D/E)XK motif protein n=1 Tax=Kribbella sp. NPDC051936 TaxID=3154946 RepID=UPI003422F2FD
MTENPVFSGSGQAQDARHLTVENVDLVWSGGHPVVLPLSGEPECRLDVHPLNGTITLITAFTPPEPDVAKWRNITFQPVMSDGEELAQLTVSVADNLHGAYGLLTSVADQLQLHHEPLASAVAISIRKHRDLFAGQAGLTTEQELGLFGELLVLEHLIEKIGPGAATESWQGPRSEEHDFVLPGIHLEVKTTSSEHRKHMMHGFTQLEPVRNTPLSLVSVQLTRASHDVGLTLGQLVSRVRRRAGGYRPAVDASLEAVGWDDAHVDLYSMFWTKRNTPQAFDVDDLFPALTSARLAAAIPNFKTVANLAYSVDLTYFTPCGLPEPLSGLVTTDAEHS